MKKTLKIGFGSVAVLLLPFLALAQGLFTTGDNILIFINATLIPILIGIAIVIFFYGVISYVLSAGDEEKRKNARGYMIYGVIGVFVMVAIFGLVKLLIDTFGIQNNTQFNIPIPTT